MPKYVPHTIGIFNQFNRSLKKNGSELPEQDANEFAKVSSEQAILQRKLESARKQSRKHGLLIQNDGPFATSERMQIINYEYTDATTNGDTSRQPPDTRYCTCTPSQSFISDQIQGM
jgi:hypothetical protein